MNFDKLEQAIIRYRESLARFRDDREALRALGVTDLPGDAPTSADTVLTGGDGDTIRRKDVIDALNGGRPGTLAAWAKDAILALPSVAPKPAPGNLPGEPTNEMLRRAVDTARDVGEPVQAGTMHAALSSALAAAPRVEVPEVTEEDVAAYNAARHKAAMDPDRRHEEHLDGLLAFRESLNARMGGKS